MLKLHKVVFLIFVIVLCSEVAFCDSVVGNLEEVEESRIKVGVDNIDELGIAKLLFKDNAGDNIPTNERYIVSYQNQTYPVIEAKILGHTVTLDIRDIDNDEKLELLVFYFAGGNQYKLELFDFSDSGLIPFINQPQSSNMRSIEIANRKILVRNISIDERGQQVENLTMYNVENSRCVLEDKGSAESK